MYSCIINKDIRKGVRIDMTSKLNILELFAGVGGFRIGFENSNKDLYNTKWSNQWEPATKAQDAFEVYNMHFPDSININENIEEIPDETFEKMDANIIVGGFPCQDYSVARSRSGELGIQGKKGVLFWEIIRATEIIRPEHLILENVDRLLKSPSNQRGRDFAVMLAALNKLDYSVEWRVINAAEYGRAQRRRRVFVYIYRNDTPLALKTDAKYEATTNDESANPTLYDDYLFEDGLFAQEFPVKREKNKDRFEGNALADDIVEVSDTFSGRFWNAGVMRHGTYYTIDSIPTGEEEPITLGEILQPENEVGEEFYLTDEKRLEKFKYLRGSKKIERTAANGHTYTYSEGGMSPVDDLDLPARTMLTSEGTTNRSTHFLKVNGRYRVLTPIEAERLQDFPDDWTKYKLVNGEKQEVTISRRRFFMGNALVTDIVRRIADRLQVIIEEGVPETTEINR